VPSVCIISNTVESELSLLLAKIISELNFPNDALPADPKEEFAPLVLKGIAKKARKLGLKLGILKPALKGI